MKGHLAWWEGGTFGGMLYSTFLNTSLQNKSKVFEGEYFMWLNR
jgi:hypothetical protein